jgi:hypothetical protein
VELEVAGALEVRGLFGEGGGRFGRDDVLHDFSFVAVVVDKNTI